MLYLSAVCVSRVSRQSMQGGMVVTTALPTKSALQPPPTSLPHTRLSPASDPQVLCADSAVSSGGVSLLATGGKDKALRVWDVASQACVATGEGHIAAVTAVALGPKGASFVVTGGADQLLKVWELPEPTVPTAGDATQAPRR